MNGYDAQDMATQGADGFRNGYQSGYADAVKAVEVGKPAAAQEAVAGFGSIHDRGPLDLALADYEREAIKHGCTNENAMAVDAAARRVWAVLQSAAPVAAAPVDTWFADQLTAMGEVIPLASTPAAPGIDLGTLEHRIRWIRDITVNPLEDLGQPMLSRVHEFAGEALELIERAKIDASPKGVMCGGCGNADEAKRCIGCTHDFHGGCGACGDGCVTNPGGCVVSEQSPPVASPKGGSDAAMVPFRRAIDLLGEAHAAGVEGRGYEDQAVKLFDARQAVSKGATP